MPAGGRYLPSSSVAGSTIARCLVLASVHYLKVYTFNKTLSRNLEKALNSETTLVQLFNKTSSTLVQVFKKMMFCIHQQLRDSSHSGETKEDSIQKRREEIR